MPGAPLPSRPRWVVWVVAVPAVTRVILSLIDYFASGPTLADFLMMTGFCCLVLVALAALVAAVIWLSRIQLRRVRRHDPNGHTWVVAVAPHVRWQILVVGATEVRLMTMWRGRTTRSWRLESVRSASLAPVDMLLAGRTRPNSYPGLRVRFVLGPEIDLAFPRVFGLWVAKKPQQARQTQAVMSRALTRQA